MAVTLGLDLGPNSIGWALVDQEKNRLIDCGVRIFPEGVDNFDTKKEKPRNEARRVARGLRRQIRRRSARKRALRIALTQAGLLPTSPDEQNCLCQLDPHELRMRALDEPLNVHDLGRVFLHLNQRRGFLSNRKKERKTSEVKGMLAEISELAADIEKSGCRTLGEYLHRKGVSLDHCKRVKNDQVRRRHTLRQMLIDEFDAIWKAQAPHHSKLLTDSLRYGSAGPQKQPQKPLPRCDDQSLLEAFGLEGLIFFQRPMYWPRSVVGMCELERKQKRCPRADRRAQRFRMLQEVNNLLYIDPETNDEKPLSDEQRSLLLEKLAKCREMDFDKIKKALGFPESVQFNLESGKRKKILGMVTDAMLAAKGSLGPLWHKLPEDKKNGIVALLACSVDDDETHRILVADHDLSAEEADAALDVELPAGYINVSVVAIEKLLPHLERGLRLMGNDETDSAMHAAGYMRRDELQRRVINELPDPSRASDARIGDIPNPVVKRALVELRKVVNAIIREHGKPDAVHVEMARAVRQGAKARSEYNSRIREIEAERDHAADEIRKLRDQGISIFVSRDTILQYLLWQQQNHSCIYCGNKISQAQLFGGSVDVDHILPYSRSLDDSQMNKVVCHRNCNADKDNRTPHEWLADTDPKRYEQVCQFARSLVRNGSLPYKKYRRIIQKELKLDDFIARQLTATGYIASATAEYLRCLFEHDHDVLGLKGELTAELRRQWGLNDVLRDDGRDRKSRDDHRHHAIDAVIVALTDRARLRQLTCIRKTGGVLKTGEALDYPWESFRDDVITKISSIKVSHRAERKVAGGLHDEMPFGVTKEVCVFVKRKPIETLSANEVDKIRDDGIKTIVTRALANAGLSIGRGKKPDAKEMKRVLSGLSMPSGVPIKKVRLKVPSKTIRPIREGTPFEVHVNPMSTHHLALFEWDENGKRQRGAVFVTMLEATNRVKTQQREFQRLLKEHEERTGKRLTKRDRLHGAFQRQAAEVAPVIQRMPPNGHPTIPTNAKCLFSLSGGETVLATVEGKEQLLVYDTAAQTSGQMWFCLHTDARKQADRKRYSFMPSTLVARKVTVDPLGRIRWAND